MENDDAMRDDEDAHVDSCRRFVALTRAGKPAWRSGGSAEEAVTLCAVTQAMCAAAEAQGAGEFRGAEAGDATVACATTSTMVYAVSSRVGEGHPALMRQLECVRAVMTSCVTNVALEEALVRNPRFDVGRALERATRAEARLRACARGVTRETPYVFGTYRAVGLESGVRKACARALGDVTRAVSKPFAGVAFGADDGRLVTYVKPRGNRPATISPMDVIVLMNYARVMSRAEEGSATTSEEPSTSRAETFGRVCLPEFNSNGFMHAYVSHIVAHAPKNEDGEDNKNVCDESTRTVGVCFLTASPDALEECRAARDALEAKLNADGSLAKVAAAIRTEMRIADLPTEALGGFQAENDEPLLHFVYNRPARHQHVSSAYAPSSSADDDVEAITRSYASLYAAMRETVGAVDKSVRPPVEDAPQRVRYERRSRRSVLACVGGDFDIYLTLKPTTTVTTAVGLCNRLCVWLRVSEPELFLDLPL